MITRRALVAGACVCAALPACTRGGSAAPKGSTDTGGHDTGDTGATGDTGTSGDSAITGDSPTGCADTGADVDGWVALALADWPTLQTVGGYAYVYLPDALLDVIVVQRAEDCFTALWRICTHGACETEWDSTAEQAVCPCHASVFAADGSVVSGPAPSALRVFPVVRRGDTLWLQRN